MAKRALREAARETAEYQPTDAECGNRSIRRAIAELVSAKHWHRTDNQKVALIKDCIRRLETIA